MLLFILSQGPVNQRYNCDIGQRSRKYYSLLFPDLCLHWFGVASKMLLEYLDLDFRLYDQLSIDGTEASRLMFCFILIFTWILLLHWQPTNHGIVYQYWPHVGSMGTDKRVKSEFACLEKQCCCCWFAIMSTGKMLTLWCKWWKPCPQTEFKRKWWWVSSGLSILHASVVLRLCSTSSLFQCGNGSPAPQRCYRGNPQQLP